MFFLSVTQRTNLATPPGVSVRDGVGRADFYHGWGRAQ